MEPDDDSPWPANLATAVRGYAHDRDFIRYWHIILRAAQQARRKNDITDEAAFFHIDQAATRLTTPILDTHRWLNYLYTRMREIEVVHGLPTTESFFDYPRNHPAIPDAWKTVKKTWGLFCDQEYYGELGILFEFYGETEMKDLLEKDRAAFELRIEQVNETAAISPDCFSLELEKARSFLPKSSATCFLTSEVYIQKIG
ncbi:MAG: hypothetical protein HY343_11770 [Lentisphaerae bacterium]|nr:hypothetical protein [Lentisphaerota bacterium]